jgi:hypothetical protein
MGWSRRLGVLEIGQRAVAHHSRVHCVKNLRTWCGLQTSPQPHSRMSRALPNGSGTIQRDNPNKVIPRKRRFSLARPIWIGFLCKTKFSSSAEEWRAVPLRLRWRARGEA